MTLQRDTGETMASDGHEVGSVQPRPQAEGGVATLEAFPSAPHWESMPSAGTLVAADSALTAVSHASLPQDQQVCPVREPAKDACPAPTSEDSKYEDFRPAQAPTADYTSAGSPHSGDNLACTTLDVATESELVQSLSREAVAMESESVQGVSCEAEHTGPIQGGGPLHGDEEEAMEEAVVKEERGRGVDGATEEGVVGKGEVEKEDGQGIEEEKEKEEGQGKGEEEKEEGHGKMEEKEHGRGKEEKEKGRGIEEEEKEEEDSDCSDNLSSQEGTQEEETVQVQKLYPLGADLLLLCGSWKEFTAENFLRGCKWAPDGSCLLTCSDDNVMRLYNTPTDIYSGITDSLPEMAPARTLPQGESVYDFCWYPRMNSWHPDTCCFATSCKDLPVHLWDAYDSQQRASYVPYNHLDEVISPHSITFSMDGSKIYCGFQKFVKVFDTDRPGRVCDTRVIYEKKSGGQSGIISCIQMHPVEHSWYALGSYSSSIGVYTDGMADPALLLLDVGGGVTHMLFSPDGHLLYGGFRKNGVLKCWDLRNPDKVLFSFEREVTTNQTIYFDLFSCGRYVISGSTDGRIYGWDVQQTEEDCNLSSLQTCLSFKAHGDAVNGCSVHPSLPILATSSGQRSFPVPYDECDDMEVDTSTPDNSVKLWSLLGKGFMGNYADIFAQ